jgi:hypothetical protein
MKKFSNIFSASTLTTITIVAVIFFTFSGFPDYCNYPKVFAQTNQALDQATTSNATDQLEITTVNKTIIPAQQTTVKANQTVISANETVY